MRQAKSGFSSQCYLSLPGCILTLANASAQEDSMEVTKTSQGSLEHSEKIQGPCSVQILM